MSLASSWERVCWRAKSNSFGPCSSSHSRQAEAAGDASGTAVRDGMGLISSIKRSGFWDLSPVNNEKSGLPAGELADALEVQGIDRGDRQPGASLADHHFGKQ